MLEITGLVLCIKEALMFLIRLCNVEYSHCFVSFWETYELFFSMTNRTKRAKKRPWSSIGNNQYIIDADQKKFGVTQCKECGIVYQMCNPEDEKTHKNYHDDVLIPKFTVCSTVL